MKSKGEPSKPRSSARKPKAAAAVSVSLTETRHPVEKRPENIHSVPPRHEEIALAAYFLSEKRGFAPGHELDDWHAAEAALGIR